MSENNCELTLGRVFDFLANELNETQRSEVLDHLDGCQTCKKEFLDKEIPQAVDTEDE